MDYHKHIYAMIEMRVLYFLIMEATHKLTSGGQSKDWTCFLLIVSKLLDFGLKILKSKITNLSIFRKFLKNKSFNIKYSCVSEYVEFLNYLYVQNTSRISKNFRNVKKWK